MTLLAPLSGQLMPLGVTRRRGGVESTYALGFDEVDDYVSCGSVDPGTVYTISVWVKLLSVSTTNRVILSNYNAAGTIASFDLRYEDTTNTWQIFYGSGVHYRLARAAAGSPLSQWIHLCWTNAGNSDGQQSLYVNGHPATLTFSNNGTPVMPTSGFGATAIGRAGDISSYYLNGLIDDVRIYNRALTAAEVQAIHRNSTAPPTSGLVAYWTCEEGSGASLADSVGSNTGTLNGGVTWQPQVCPRLIAGRQTGTWSGSFDGTDDYVAINDLLGEQSALTVSCWAKQSSASNNRALVAQWNHSGTERAWVFAQESSVSVNWRSAGDIEGFTSGGDSLTASWQHVAFVFDGSASGNANRLKIFINGVEQSISYSTTVPASLKNASTGVEIGRLNGVGRFFNGNIRDVRIYSVAKTAAQIRSLSRGIDDTTNLVGHWKLDEGSGTTATDSSGQGNNGTLTNGATYTGDVPQWFRQTIESSQSLSLDGVDDRILVANLDRNVLSWECWIKRGRTATTEVIVDSETNNGGFEIYFNTSNQIVFGKRGVSGVNSTGTIAETTNWHHIAITYDGSTARFYIDGVSAGSAAYSETFNSSGDLYTLFAAGSLLPFQGTADDITISSRVASASEIADQAAGYLVPAGLVSRWKLDGNANDTIGSNHGTEQGGATYSSTVPGTL